MDSGLNEIVCVAVAIIMVGGVLLLAMALAWTVGTESREQDAKLRAWEDDERKGQR